MRFSRPPRKAVPDDSPEPMERFSARRMTRKENVLKQEIDSYRLSDVDNTAIIYVGSKAVSIYQTLDLPDATCDGLTFKQRLVQTEGGDCLLLARWKPDRYMRRSAPDWSQKWFVEKKLFPPDLHRFFSRAEKRVEEANAAIEAAEASE